MNVQRRSGAYRRQTGLSWLTPKQRRRVRHKANHEAAPFGAHKDARPIRVK